MGNWGVFVLKPLPSPAPPALLLLLCLVATWVRPAHAVQPRETLPPAGYQTIPLRRTADNHWYLSGKLNGQRRSFLVDTGWSYTTVAHRSETNALTVREIQLGRTTFTAQPARQQRLVIGGQPAPFDVVLGLDFLRRHSAILDCGANRLYTRPAPPTAAEQAALNVALERAGYVSVDLRVREPLTLTCPATIADQSLEMLVDSGGAWSCFDWKWAESSGLKPQASTTRLSGSGKTGVRGLAVAEVKSLRLGRVEIPRGLFGLVTLADWGLGREGQPLSEVKGLIGGELLAAHRAVIDCASQRLWLKPPTKR